MKSIVKRTPVRKKGRKRSTRERFADCLERTEAKFLCESPPTTIDAITLRRVFETEDTP